MRICPINTVSSSLMIGLAGSTLAMASLGSGPPDRPSQPTSLTSSVMNYVERSTDNPLQPLPLPSIGKRLLNTDDTESGLTSRGVHNSDSESGGSVSDYFGRAWERPSGSSHPLTTPTESTGTPFSTESSGSDSNDSRGRGLVRNRFARVIRHGTPPPFSSPEPDWSKKRVPPAHRKQQRRLKAMMGEPAAGTGIRGPRPTPLQIPGKPRQGSGGKKLWEYLNLGNPDDWKKSSPSPKTFQKLNLNGIPGSPPPRAWEAPPQKKKGVASRMGGMAKSGMGKLTKGFKKLFGKRSLDGFEQQPAPGGGFFFRHTQAATEPRFPNGPQFFKSERPSNSQGRYAIPPLPPTAPKRFKELEGVASPLRHTKPPRTKKVRGAVQKAKKTLKKIGKFFWR
ncbi:hypothetical protein BCV69DRAFT_300919 [Microstroma glucosiphilum]|uniref:Uncharacterized protein n=1 Tax=Pseudomicrostroma glucosiphilum TaxID=1684307 RepID=A0A316U016_9BASI|nr:hypothetical protein BCV69DRAFT_300919 [Pseudomicrostroma glucosiphilum]PWN18762.1 hypothetical protein BCV69DRAFT_300919 [Pseudomicrostroma glucosiphilum]